MSAEIVEMAQLDEINGKLDQLINGFHEVRNTQAVQQERHGQLRERVDQLQGRVEEQGRQINSLEHKHTQVERLKEDLNQLGEALRRTSQTFDDTLKRTTNNLTEQFQLVVSTAIRESLAPYQQRQTEHGIWFKVLHAIGSGGWSIFLIVAAAAIGYFFGGKGP